MKFKETLAQFTLQIRNVMGKLTPTQRLSLGLLAGVVAVSFVILIIINMSSGGGGYENLFYQPLDAERQAYVIQKLGTADYKIEDGAIKVRKNDRDRLAAVFMQDKQVAQEKDWFASLFESNLMDTDALRDKKFFIARERQLSAQISYFDSVKRASVNINPGDDTRYMVDDMRKATAAVMVELKPGVNKLTQDTVNSIAHTVAFSIKGLSPENVSISDYSGKNYRPTASNDNAPSDNERLEITARISEFYEERIRQYLADYPGVCVLFFPNINWDKMEQTEKIYPKQEEPTYTREVEKTTGGSQSAGGTPGVTPNVDDGTGVNRPQDVTPAPAPSETGEASSHIKTLTEPFPNTDEKVKIILTNPGVVDDRMVTVSIPYNILAAPVSGGKIPEDPAEAEKVVQKNIDDIKKQIKTAIGLGNAPEDDAKVCVAARHPIEAPAEIKVATLSESFWESVQPLVGKVPIVLIALFSLILVATFVKRNIPKPQQIPIEEIEEKIEKEVEKEKKDFLSDMEKIDDKELKAMQVKERVQEMIDENAEGAANLLKSWIQKET
jgi:flagellar biosynthesis/type III secretory pathway M-ring protein FliF/YscJ